MTAKAEKGKHLTGNKAHLGDIVGSVPDHRNKMNIAIKEVAGISCFPRANKSYVYTILKSIRCAISMMFEKIMHIP